MDGLENGGDKDFSKMVWRLPQALYQDKKVVERLIRYILGRQYPFDLRQAAKKHLLLAVGAHFDHVGLVRNALRRINLDTELDDSYIVELILSFMQADPEGFLMKSLMRERDARRLQGFNVTVLEAALGLNITILLRWTVAYVHGTSFLDVAKSFVRRILAVQMDSPTGPSRLAVNVPMFSNLLSLMAKELFKFLSQRDARNTMAIFSDLRTWALASWPRLNNDNSNGDECYYALIVSFLAQMCEEDPLVIVKLRETVENRNFSGIVRGAAAQSLTNYKTIGMKESFDVLCRVASDSTEDDSLRIQAMKSMGRIAHRANLHDEVLRFCCAQAKPKETPLGMAILDLQAFFCLLILLYW